MIWRRSSGMVSRRPANGSSQATSLSSPTRSSPRPRVRSSTCARSTPSALATDFGERWDKDPRKIEVVLREAWRIVRMHNGLIIAETVHGFVCANAGVDASNASPDGVVLLPRDPDASAADLREALRRRFALNEGDGCAVIVSDSFGRPWRNGIVNVAIGVSGMAPLVDYRGETDRGRLRTFGVDPGSRGRTGRRGRAGDAQTGRAAGSDRPRLPSATIRRSRDRGVI